MPNQHRPLKVFLCHASQDKSAVRELSRRLTGEGWVDTWLDEKSLLPGQDWRLNIEEAVETSDIVIICLSDNSVSKEGYIQKELRYAREIALEKPDEMIFLIPLRLDDCVVPRGLRFYQWVDYFGENKSEAYRALIESLKLRYAQKLKLAEQERVRKEKLDSEVAEKLAQEKAEREAIEKARVEEQIREKAAKEKVEHAAADKAAQEIAEREEKDRQTAAQAKGEKANATEAKPAPKNFQIESKETKAFFLQTPTIFRVVGSIVVLVVLIGLASQLIGDPFLPTATATATRKPAVKITSTNSPVLPTKTTKPQATPTKKRTPVPTTSTIIESTDAQGVPMMFVPAGNFTMGKDDDYLHGYYQPAHTVYLDAFRIDKYEVTNARYKACVDAGACTPPQNLRSRTRTSYYGNSDFDNYPVISVTWSQAKLYCEWRDGSLPTEAQWEKAARGTDERKYPWGDEEIDCNKANVNGCTDDSTEVGSYKGGVSPYGVHDMTGNVWEWVADYYSATYYKYSPTSNPVGPNSGEYRVVRGSSSSFLWGFQTYARGDAGYVVSDIGFRCARDAAP